ncbi:unnamed protein product [Periconia digitata]|uniref:Uncharacterized protein n=1 Tax=Periconia digitata TaxID=1303443 RepID=A0A9W4UU11_9PLEO|nr:unnamed protein product [Periconia digitata]
MGCGASREKLNSTDEWHRNRGIDNGIKSDKVAQRKEIKILLLGAGESGKSTLLRQMKLIHEGEYSIEERKWYRPVVFSNTVQSMAAVVDAMEPLGISFADETLRDNAQLLADQPDRIEDESLPESIGAAISLLWRDAGVRECFDRSREYQLNDSAKYYFDSISRIASPGYVPSDQDVLRTRVKTTGITETRFTVGSLTHRVCDVGGQRTERRKWIHCFSDVKIIMFVAAISEYDQLLFEDGTIKRMDEALVLFESIANSQWFIGTPFILFFNKIDRLKEKLQMLPLVEYYPDFAGGENYAAACAYFSKRFTSLCHDDSKPIYTQFTCATDSNQVELVMSAVNDIIAKSFLESSVVV